VVLVLILKLLPQFPTPVELVLYCIPYLVVGWDVLRKALLGIKNRQPFDECFLMAVATVGAFALGDYVEGCAVIIFYQIGELFQSVAVGKSRQSISSLMDIRPDYANIEGEDGKLEQVDPDDVEIGNWGKSVRMRTRTTAAMMRCRFFFCFLFIQNAPFCGIHVKNQTVFNSFHSVFNTVCGKNVK